jgi:peptide/nickel transport system substrate-binding protein
MALAMAEQLRKIGVRLNVKAIETGVFRRLWLNGDLPAYFISYGNVAEDASTFLKQYFRSGQDRRSRYKNPEVDAVFDEQEAEQDTTKRKALNHRLLRLLQEDSPAVPLYNPYFAVAVRKRVSVPAGLPTAGEFVWFWKLDVG